MAKNPAPEHYVSEADSEDSGSEYETESEPEHLKKKSEAVKPPSSSSSEAETETGSDSDPSKTMDEEKISKLKRPREETPTPTEDPKKMKVGADDPEKKRVLFQRLWSEEDEIVLVCGMMDYWSKKKSNPVSDLNDFHEYIKKDLHVQVTRSQLQDKIRRLKKKYKNNNNRGRQSFSKSHEQKLYDVSSRIWGSRPEAENTKDVGEKGKSPLQTMREIESVSARMEQSMLKNGEEMFEEGRGVEEKNEWEKLRFREMELFRMLLKTRIAQTRLVLNAMKTSPPTSFWTH